MAVLACLFLLLSCGIAAQATPTLSLATPPAGCCRGTDELDEILVKRTSGSSSHRPLLRHLQGPVPQSTGLQSLPLTHIHPGAALRTAASFQVPADGHSAPNTAPESSSKRPEKAKRRPYGSLKNNAALRAKAGRASQARMMQRIKNGERVNQRKLDGSKYALESFEDYQRSQSAHAARRWRNFNDDDKAKYYQRRNESARRVRAKRKAQREAEREGRIWQASPVRKRGRPRKYWDDELEQAKAGVDDVRLHEPADTRMGDKTQHAVQVTHASSTTVWPRLTEASSGSSSLPASLSGALHQFFPPGPSSSSLDHGLSLWTPGSSTSGQRQTTRAPRRVEPPPAARTWEEKRLRLTLAPPGQHGML